MRDQVAVVGTATTGFTRQSTGRTRLELAAAASTAAIDASGLTPGDIDGLVGIAPPAPALQEALGIPLVNWWTTTPYKGGFAQAFVAAIQAIVSGSAATVLAYHTVLRHREGAPTTEAALSSAPDRVWPPAAYAERAASYLKRYGRTTADFGLAAINSRSNAISNPGAAFRSPLDLDGHAAARIVCPPLGLLDMDAPVDGADAFVLTSAERAAGLPGPAVLVHAMAAATHHPQDGPQQQTVIARLRASSDLWLDDLDVYYPYDGFSLLVCTWIEAARWCGPGEAGDFMRTHWDKESGRVLIHGRIPLNTHGGSLSEGGSQGSGHLREAVTQLQGRAGARQVPGARTALVTPGGLFVNAHGFVLRTAT